MLGFALAYHQRTMMRFGRNRLKIGLMTVLRRAEIDIPEESVAKFLESIERAMSDLNADGVIPGLQLVLPPEGDAGSARRRVELAQVEMDPAPDRPDPLHTLGYKKSEVAAQT